METVKRVAIIPGDGIGVEVVEASLQVLDSLMGKFNFSLELERFPWNADYYLKYGKMVTEEELAYLETLDAIYFGAIGDPRIPDMAHGRALLLKLRTSLGLCVNQRPYRSYNEALSPLKPQVVNGVDTVVFRENTQGLYVQVGGELSESNIQKVAIDTAVYTKEAVERLMHFAFEWARNNGRKKVTLVDKANAVTNIGSMWRNVFKDYAEKYPDLITTNEYIDAFCTKAVLNPTSYDVIVSSNLFGDIISDLGAGICGGLGLLPSASINPDKGIALFEPVHGSAPDIAGKGIANPCAALFSLAMMLEYLGYFEAGNALSVALEGLLEHETERLPQDLGGNASTREFTDSVIKAVNMGSYS